MQTKTIHRGAARGVLRKTLRQKTAPSNVNAGGIGSDTEDMVTDASASDADD